MVNAELRSALIEAFPPTPITREVIDAADARWDAYEERDDLALVEGKAWVDLTAKSLERNAGLLVHAGGELYRAILPAYLLLLVENECSNILPFHVLTQLTSKDSRFDQQIFEDRVGQMSGQQHQVVRRAIALLTEQELLHETASTAIRSW